MPLLFFNFVGFELPSAAGDEMKDPQKDVPFTVMRAAIASVLLYGVPILAILMVLPSRQITGLGGFIDAMKTVFTVYGGEVTKDGATLTGPARSSATHAAVGFILVLLSSGDVAHGLRPHAGRRRLRRRRPARRSALLQQVRHADRRQLPERHGLHDRHGAGLPALRRQRREVLQRRARTSCSCSRRCPTS